MSGIIIEAGLHWANRCPFCGKRKATRTCDMPVGMVRFAGHPPGGIGSMCRLTLCRRKMCDECAYPVSDGTDLCPTCVRNVKLTQQGRKQKPEVET